MIDSERYLTLLENRGVKLNEGQTAVFRRLYHFCLESDKFKWITLEGIAGSGKTFVLNRVIEAVKATNPNISIGMTAPTHKAVRVLRNHSEMKNRLDFGTIHSFLGLKQKHDEKTGKVTFEPEFGSERERKIDTIQVLIVDETSMLQDDLFGYIEDEVRSGHLKVIFMGDPLQIPPVGKKKQTGENNAIPFMKSRQEAHKIDLVSLTEPQRQAANSPIILYATAIRHQGKRQFPEFEFKEEYKDHLEKIAPRGNLPLLHKLFEEYFGSPEFEADPDYVKVIAWQNKTVNYFNHEIRLLLNKKYMEDNNLDTLPSIIVGDRLVLDQPLIVGKKIIMQNNEEVRVVECEIVEEGIDYRLIREGNSFKKMSGEDEDKQHLRTWDAKFYKVVLKDEEGKVTRTKIIHEDVFEEFKDIRERLATAAKESRESFNRKTNWQQFFRLEKMFCWVKHNYCLTAHKAQGSTYKYCFVMGWDIYMNKLDLEERNRIMYVGATRPTEKLWVIMP